MSEDVQLELVVEALERGHQVEIVVTGTSMLPSIPSGSRIRLSPPRAISLGDICAATIDKRTFVVHRVVGLRCGGWVLTKGDSNRGPDPWIQEEQIVAHVDGVTPPAGVGQARGAETVWSRWRRWCC